MRLNKYLAQATDLSRRKADQAIADGRVEVDGKLAAIGTEVSQSSQVKLDGILATPDLQTTIIMLNKPVGYVCSRNGQGSQTIYDLLPAHFKHLNPIGRLDKNSSGLLLLTNNGQLAQELTHPKYQKVKKYHIKLNKPLQPLHQQMISDRGITLDDGKSQFVITTLTRSELDQTTQPSSKLLNTVKPAIKQSKTACGSNTYEVQMHEGRNRQIRRTFEALGYTVIALHRTDFGRYGLTGLKSGKVRAIKD